MDAAMQEKLAMIETVQNWAVWRDAGDWERFKTVWHDDGWMSATWFQGPALAFIEVSKSGFEKGVSILHFLGGSAVDLAGNRAVAQTKMTINQRATVDNVEVDVVCTGRFYDFFEKRRVGNVDAWKIVRRQPIYEKDRMDVVDPHVTLKLDVDLLGQVPEGLSPSGLPAEQGRLQDQTRHAVFEGRRGAGLVCAWCEMAGR